MTSKVYGSYEEGIGEILPATNKARWLKIQFRSNKRKNAGGFRCQVGIQWTMVLGSVSSMVLSQFAAVAPFTGTGSGSGSSTGSGSGSTTGTGSGYSSHIPTSSHLQFKVHSMKFKSLRRQTDSKNNDGMFPVPAVSLIVGLPPALLAFSLSITWASPTLDVPPSMETPLPGAPPRLTPTMTMSLVLVPGDTAMPLAPFKV